MEVKIEKGIPIPEVRRNRQNWPFDELGLEDSFRIKGVLGTARNQCSRYGKRLGRRFICRQDGDEFVRVWRIK